MSDMEILSQLIKTSALVSLQSEYGKKLVKLTEPSAPSSSATICNLPDDAAVIKVDEFFQLGRVFGGEKGECKRADFVIVSAEKKCIIYIEMKKEKEEWDHIVKQLMGAQCFILYCKEIGKAFWKEKSFLEGYQSRFISIGHTYIRKRRTRVTKCTATHDAPNNAMKIDWPARLQYNHLACLRA